MAVIVREVRLRGFLSHANTQLGLHRGSYALVGENGAGKSSIVDALRLALLMPSRPGAVRGGELVNYSSPLAEVAVRLYDDVRGGEYEVVVRLRRSTGRGGAERSAELYALEGGRRRRLAFGVNDVRKRLMDLFNLPPGKPDLLEYTAILPQGRLSQIVNDLLANPAKLRRSLEDLLGVSDYERARSLLDRRVEVRLGENLGSRPLQKTLPRRLREERARLERELERRRGEARELQEKLREAEEEIGQLQARLGDLKRAKQEYVKTKARLEEAERRLRQLKERAARIRAEIERLRAAAARLGRIEAEIERLESTAGLRGLLTQYWRLRGEAEAAEKNVESLREALEAAERIPQLEGEARHYEDSKKRLEELQEERARLLSLKARLENQVGEAEKRLERAREAAGRIEALLRSNGLKPPSTPPEILDYVDGLLEKLAGEADRLEEEARRLAGEAARLRGLAGEARERAEKLLQARGGRCPLCGAELPRERAEKLATQLLEEAERLEANASTLESDASRLRGDARRLRQLAGRLEGLAGRLREALEGAPEERVIEGLREQLVEVTRHLEGLDGLRRELQARLERLEEAWRTYQYLLETLKRRGYDPRRPGLAGELRARLGEAEERLEALRSELSKMEERLLEATSAGSVAEAEEAVRRAEERLERLRREAEEARAARARMAVLEEQLASIEREAAQAEVEASRLRETLERLHPLAEEADMVEERLQELQRGVGELQGKLAQLRGQITELEGLLREYDAAIERAERAVTVLRVLEEAPPLVLQSRLALLSGLMSEALSRFGLDIVSASFRVDRDGVRLVVTRANGQAADPAGLSGGEKVALALSFVVALARLHSVRAGFLVLDEPTAELDRHRRQTLIEVLRGLASTAGVPQLIVVTHDEDVAEAADVVCRVEKEAGISRVTCPEALEEVSSGIP